MIINTARLNNDLRTTLVPEKKVHMYLKVIACTMYLVLKRKMKRISRRFVLKKRLIYFQEAL